MKATHCNCGGKIEQPLGRGVRKYCVSCAKKARRGATDRWQIRNLEKKREITRCWKKNNPERNRENHRRYQYLRRLRDPSYRAVVNLRSRISDALKGFSKSATTLKLLGCNIFELWAHLESKFVLGMTRENYGPVWHVDHVRSCASFNLSDPEQQRECFNYKNLQPLFALDNIKKGAS